MEKASTETLSSAGGKKVVIPANRLKVLHICQRDDPATGGAVRVAVEYIKRLPDYEIDAHCLFLYGSPGYFQSELGDRAHYLNIKNSKEFLIFGRLTKFLQEFKPDVIHHHDGLLWCQLLTFFHPGMVKVAHAHLPASKKTTFSKETLAAWLQRRSTDILICINEDTRQSQIEQGQYLPSQTQVLYNGVDQKRFYKLQAKEKINARQQFGLPVNAHVVGFVGRLHCAMKGTDDFLRVIALLPANFYGLVVGSGVDFDTLKQLTKTLKISNRVIFTGTLENTVSGYQAMDVFCLTSHWEPFGLVVAEAMACGIPVVGFACDGGVKQLLTPLTGYVLPQRDIAAMAQAIVKAVEHPEQWEQRQTNAQSQLQQNHDWKKNTSSLAFIYKKLIKLKTNFSNG
ncbi:MAG: glycosyltransferase family 4 protein [Moorea sp. SIO3G5]|nr:glycosyltransferase family 4 protein [Moorena sp. SIO3G5]